jgi:hypothetical protein
MARLAPLAFIAGALAVLAALSGCDGQVIRLGGGSMSVDGAACPHAQVPASQVLWIGDSWQLLPSGSEAHTEVRNLARAAGAIGPSDDYTIAAEAAAPMIVPTTAGGPTPIPTQYAKQEASANVKVLIMDGGTWDTINSDTTTTVSNVIASFNRLLSSVATGGTVTDVIYFLMPLVVSGVDELRPGLEGVCTSSAVPCHFIDLESSWSTGDDTGGSVPVPTASGAEVIANQIWAIMQTYCIAQ